MSATPAASLELKDLRKLVRAAAAEFDMAVMFYEVWRTAMDDDALHGRLGVSFTTNTFRVVVTALRRELLLALIRMWDKPKSTLRMSMIAEKIRNSRTLALLAEERGTNIEKKMIRPNGHVSRASVETIVGSVRGGLNDTATKALAISDKYAPGGSGFTVLEKLRTLRHERLAHYAVEAVSVPTKNATDQEIEGFYRDNSELVRLLLSLVTATAYDPQQNAEVQRTYAKLFWASVRGERTEGHPNFRAS
jgi:hypothetical protein